MTFWQAIKATYSGSFAFLAACPLLALVPVVCELVQHLAEVHIGMYASVAAAKAFEHHPLRLGFGLLKIASLTVPGYWVVRFLAYRDPAVAGRLEPVPARLFAGYFAFQMAMAVIQLFVLPQTPAVQLLAFLPALAISTAIVAWGVAAPLGNAAIGPVRSARIMGRHLPWSLALYLAAFLPLLVPHYALGALAILGPARLLWPVLIVDSLLVGVMAPVMIAAGYHAAQRAAASAQVSLGAAPTASDLPGGAGVRQS